jgi:hypothetical protein
MIEFGDYILIEEGFEVVAIAEFFKTLPVKYEHLKKTHSILGRADKESILVGANQNPRYTIVLEKKIKKTLVTGISVSDLSSLRRSV